MSDKKNNKENEIDFVEKKDPSSDFEKQLSALLKSLFYISETDAEVVFFNGQKANFVNRESLLLQIGKKDIKVEELSFESFFEPLTKTEDWLGREERKMTESFSKIKTLLQENLRDIRVFKIGKIHIEIFVIGLDSEGNLCGIKTKALET